MSGRPQHRECKYPEACECACDECLAAWETARKPSPIGRERVPHDELHGRIVEGVTTSLGDSFVLASRAEAFLREIERYRASASRPDEAEHTRARVLQAWIDLKAVAPTAMHARKVVGA